MAKTATDNTKSVQRDQQVLAILEENGLTSVHELCEKLYLSEATVRRCLSSLARKGLIHRTHGGAELLKTFTNAGPFSSRIHQNAAAKRSIAQKAAGLVPNGSIVFLDQSSTCLHLAEALKDKQDLTVVTNNIAIASLLSTTNFEVHLSGGYLCDKARVCLVGADSHQIFLNICADFVFFSTHSLSSDGIATDCNREEINVRNAMLKNAKCKVLLCDSSKFNSTAGFIQCALQDLDMLISEEHTAEAYAHRFPGMKCL